MSNNCIVFLLGLRSQANFRRRTSPVFGRFVDEPPLFRGIRVLDEREHNVRGGRRFEESRDTERFQKPELANRPLRRLRPNVQKLQRVFELSLAVLQVC